MNVRGSPLPCQGYSSILETSLSNGNSQMKLDVRILLAIGAGGALGSIARYIVNVLI